MGKYAAARQAGSNTFTKRQRQTPAKQNGVSIARTKADFVKLLDQVEPGFSHANPTGAALKAKLKAHEIGLPRTKEALVKRLAETEGAETNPVIDGAIEEDPGGGQAPGPDARRVRGDGQGQGCLRQHDQAGRDR